MSSQKPSPNGASPESLGVPQDTKSNPSNGLVERVARIVAPGPWHLFDSAEPVLADAGRRDVKTSLRQAREIHALYQQEGVLSSQLGEALESILAKLGVVETIMVNRGWHRQAVGGYLTDAGLWLDRAMSELRKLVSHAEGENRSANASLRPGLSGPDTEAEPSAALDGRDRAAFIQQGLKQQAARLAGAPFLDWLLDLAKLAEPDNPAEWLVGSVVLNEECWFDCFADGYSPASCWTEECSYD